MSTIQEAIQDKNDMEAKMLQLIAVYQQKHPGLMVESISIITTTVSGYPPVQRLESTIKI